MRALKDRLQALQDTCTDETVSDGLARLIDELDVIVAEDAPGYGEIHQPETMFLRTGVGTAQDPDDPSKSYDMDTSMAGTPIVRSQTTGKWFTLGWQHLINMAVAAGIDQPEPTVAREVTSD